MYYGYYNIIIYHNKGLSNPNPSTLNLKGFIMDNTSPSTPSTEDARMNDEQLIKALFELHVDSGGNPRITEFRSHLNNLMAKHIRPLTGCSGAYPSSSGNKEWRHDLKSRFGGRGKKWVYTSIESVLPYLDAFDERGVSTLNYRAWIERFGRAWVRYTGPRIHQGKPSAAFEIRTLGSTIDQPKELFYLPIEQLDDLELLRGTPYSWQLEFEVTHEAKVEETNEESINEDVDLDDELEADDDDM